MCELQDEEVHDEDKRETHGDEEVILLDDARGDLDALDAPPQELHVSRGVRRALRDLVEKFEIFVDGVIDIFGNLMHLLHLPQ